MCTATQNRQASEQLPNFCSTCPYAQVCLTEGMNDGHDMRVLIEHVGPVHAGTPLFRQGDEFDSIYVVRSGAVKTASIDSDGREQVLGFHLPGEVIGLDGIADSRHPTTAIALDTVTLCRFSFPRLSELASRVPGLQARLFQTLSRNIVMASHLAGNYSADERLAAFLVGMAQRLSQRGFSGTRMQLPMSRTDVANYLRVAPETMSRLLKRFQDDGLLAVDGRDVELVNRERLQEMAAPALAA